LRNTLVGLGPNHRLDRYDLLCAIGQGGMATVWAARRRDEQGAGELVAIKTILPEYAYDTRFRAMLLDEGRIASRIEHNNVARILDWGEEGHLLYLVMEWINGDSLSQLRRRLSETNVEMPLGIVLRILADLSGGLHAAHELCDASGNSLSVVHRDVSPENILVDVHGSAKLIDFGVAKARDRAAEATKTGILKGKLAYMAPEQALKGQADRRSDVWAVGAILFKFLSGKTPFQGENQAATLCLLVSGENPPPLPAEVHPAVAAVVERALRHDPAERYATAAELQTALVCAMVDAEVPTTVDDVAVFVSTHMADRIAARRDAIAQAIRAAEPAEKVGERVGTRTGTRTIAPPVKKLDLWQEDHSPTDVERDATTRVGRDVLNPRSPKLSRAFDVLVVIAALAGVLFLWRGRAQFSRRHFTSIPAVSLAPAPRASAVEVPPTASSPADGTPRADAPAIEIPRPDPDPAAAPPQKTKRNAKPGKPVLITRSRKKI
jgi:serine/threonine-protein kinase